MLTVEQLQACLQALPGDSLVQIAFCTAGAMTLALAEHVALHPAEGAIVVAAPDASKQMLIGYLADADPRGR